MDETPRAMRWLGLALLALLLALPSLASLAGDPAWISLATRC